MIDLHTLLLRDSDGDGLFDGLSGKLWLPESASTELLRAAAEVIAYLASRAVALSPELVTLQYDLCGFYIGRYPPRKKVHPEGFEVGFNKQGVRVAASSDAALLAGVNNFLQWLDGLQASPELSLNHLQAAPKRLSWQQEKITLELTSALATAPDWHHLPNSLAVIRAASRSYSNPQWQAAPYQPMPTPTPHALRSLGTVLQGGGLYSGEAQRPERLQGGLAMTYPCREAIKVAGRLSTEGLETRLPVTVQAAAASVIMKLDTSLAANAEMSIKDTQLELVGQSSEALAQLSSYFATTFPQLPDGTRLGELEQNLEAFLNTTTRIGCMASIAAQLTAFQGQVKRALMPNPLACAPRLLGVPVRNSSRDGKRQQWRTAFVWEGSRLLEAIETLNLSPEPGRVSVYAFVSEDQRVRQRLRDNLRRRLKKQGLEAVVTLYSAYKPGLFWLLEFIAPQLSRDQQINLQVSCAPQTEGSEVEDRWLRELYPAAEVLAKRYPMLTLSFELAAEQRLPYHVKATTLAGELLLAETFAPPTQAKSYLGNAELGTVYPTTGWLKVIQGNEVLLDRHLPTDRDLAWDWYTHILQQLRSDAHGPGPFFADLSIHFSASEPDLYLGLDHEHSSAIEAMHEEFYFGTLEALQAKQASFQQREVTPGWVLPFCKETPEQDVQVQVIKQAVGSRRLGLETVEGEFYPSPSHHAKVRVTSLALADEAVQLRLEVEAPSEEAASFFEAKVRWLQAHRLVLADHHEPLPSDVHLEIHFFSAQSDMAQLEVVPHQQAQRSAADLRKDRPFTARETLRQAQVFKARFPFVHLSPLRETRLGQPLVSLEASSLMPYASRTRLAHWKPSILISARQHANEPTSTQANFLWLNKEIKNLLRSFNVIFNPLENPDGARLYTALCQLAPHHMHHAARYNSLGMDVQTAAGPQQGATRMLHDSIRDTWSPLVHLNNHGYPAHEWTRPHSAYVPKAFEDWSLPFGYLTILIAAPEAHQFMREVQTAVAHRLQEHQGLTVFTQAQVQRGQRYRKNSQPPFDFVGAFPFLCRVINEADPSALDRTSSSLLTVISEVPDETVRGDLWRDCIKAHQTINQAVVAALLQYLEV